MQNGENLFCLQQQFSPFYIHHDEFISSLNVTMNVLQFLCEGFIVCQASLAESDLLPTWRNETADLLARVMPRRVICLSVYSRDCAVHLDSASFAPTFLTSYPGSLRSRFGRTPMGETQYDTFGFRNYFTTNRRFQLRFDSREAKIGEFGRL